MNLSAIRHRSTGSECYALDENTVALRLCTGYDVDKAYVISEDPFIAELKRLPEWDGVEKEMTRGYELEHHIVWTAELTPEFKRLQYYFIVESDGERYCVFENKVCKESERNKISTEFFKFPWINPADVISPPAWVRDTVWYQIMPDRFCRGSDFNNSRKFRKWGDFSNPTFKDIYGGNLRGIRERLPYLKELGISGIYLTPIFYSNSDHKYNTFDYYMIDPDFGDEAEFKALVEEAHKLGIRIMLDAVFNHCGSEFFAWNDVWENGRKSKYFDWFFINKDDFAKHQFTADDGRYYTFSFWAPMPKLNTNNPEVQRYFTELCVHWARDFDIDGIRFDVGDEVSHRFLKEMHRAVKEVKPDIFLLGEIWFDSIGWLGGDEYDSVMNYPLPGAIGDFWQDREMTAHELMHRLNFCRTLYPKQINEVMFNFLDTHDTPRVRETCENTDVLLQKLAMLFTAAGTPCIYYGTEIAMKGKKTPYNRSCMPWEEIDAGKYDDFSKKVRELIQMRKRCSATKKDELQFIFDETHPRLVCYKKDDLTVYLNAGDGAVSVSAGGTAVFANGYNGGTLEKDGVLITLR